MNIKPEVREAWVAALRSGRFEQGQGFLNKDGKLCCLGVLCEVAIEAGVPVKKQVDSEYGDPSNISYDEHGAFPPESVREWAGVNAPDSWIVEVDGLERTLPYLNDFSDYTFEQIADVIEASV
jgi:hypothetical protein